MSILDWNVSKKITPAARGPIGDPRNPQDPNRPPLTFRLDFHFTNKQTLKSFDYFEPECLDVRPDIIDMKAYNQIAQIEGVAALPTEEQNVDLSRFIPKDPDSPTDDDIAAANFGILAYDWFTLTNQLKIKKSIQSEVDDAAALLIEAYVGVSKDLEKRFNDIYNSFAARV